MTPADTAFLRATRSDFDAGARRFGRGVVGALLRIAEAAAPVDGDTLRLLVEAREQAKATRALLKHVLRPLEADELRGVICKPETIEALLKRRLEHATRKAGAT